MTPSINRDIRPRERERLDLEAEDEELDPDDGMPLLLACFSGCGWFFVFDFIWKRMR
jgi:hypothetical protein